LRTAASISARCCAKGDTGTGRPGPQTIPRESLRDLDDLNRLLPECIVLGELALERCVGPGKNSFQADCTLSSVIA
jgi:hypothetical protein